MSETPPLSVEPRVTINSITATIAAGESLSSAAQSGTQQVVSILIPSDWDPIAGLSFQISPDNNNYYDVFSNVGSEIIMPAIPGTAIILGASWMQAISWFKIRSGTRNYPVKQVGQRTLTIFLL